MTTQKEVLNKFKETKGKLTCIAFKDGKRELMYSGINMVQALKMFSLRSQIGQICLLLEDTKENNLKIYRIEKQNGRRALFSEVLPMSITFRI